MNQPLHDYVIIRPSSGGNLSAGGLELPSTMQKVFARGMVEAVGPGRFNYEGKRIPMSVIVGDEVMYMPQAALEFEAGLVTTPENNIIHVINRPNGPPVNQKKRLAVGDWEVRK